LTVIETPLNKSYGLAFAALINVSLENLLNYRFSNPLDFLQNHYHALVLCLSSELHPCEDFGVPHKFYNLQFGIFTENFALHPLLDEIHLLVEFDRFASE